LHPAAVEEMVLPIAAITRLPLDELDVLPLCATGETLQDPFLDRVEFFLFAPPRNASIRVV
jgi:hypothetical protein